MLIAKQQGCSVSIGIKYIPVDAECVAGLCRVFTHFNVAGNSEVISNAAAQAGELLSDVYLSSCEWELNSDIISSACMQLADLLYSITCIIQHTQTYSYHTT